MSEHGWIGVDLDGTLAHYEHWIDGQIGAPILPMLERVKAWRREGQEVRIVTARIGIRPQEPDVNGNEYSSEEAEQQRALIEAWCLEHVGEILPVTCQKDFQMIELWDDRCVQVIPNTGMPLRDVILQLVAKQEPADV
jgi:hypothetical protein